MVQIALILCIIIAILTIQTQKLRTAVIYLGLFSIVISFVYTVYNALDVAIAEAVIGSALATILFVVTLQKYVVFTIYYHMDSERVDDRYYKRKEKHQMIKQLEVFCAKEELDPQIFLTVESVDDIKRRHDYDIIIEETEGDLITIYSHPENYKQDKLEHYLCEYLHQKRRFKFKYVEDEEI